ncbi:TadE/TadG family type IV pilus assembly protein [Plastoroseomonas hellenica]|uniref:TadE/TadG family type IV pilus assembly protein n=1 Tax=Plastoroseomonas hellenica TaxID=2687306 RepID=UPI001BA47A7E|nr:TadE/TadG family type IV pilus assembly protein [Plastoroseomonas hellenica]MBR0642118.1 pilus assembly protein [Plastoroseomonas hellenica]
MTLGRFRGDRRGNVAILTALIAVALFGSAGLAIDATRAWMLRSRLATSLDAAAITAARGYSPTANMTTLTSQACAVFWANFGVSSTTNPCGTTNEGRGFLRAMSTNPTISVGSDSVLTVTATARLDTTFMRLLGINQVGATAASAAIRTITSLEIALALDVTGSMYENDKIGALRTAAANFITTIYGSSEIRENTWVSVVPYTTHVNIGPMNSAMVTSASLQQFTPNGLTLLDTRQQPVGWAGCVEARYQSTTNPVTGAATSGDLVDRPPTELPYQAYFNPSTLNTPTTPGSNPISLYYRTLSNGSRVRQPGDNEWTTYQVDPNRAINEWALNQGTPRVDAPPASPAEDARYLAGPNLGCLYESRYRILPLTAARSTILAKINGLLADPWYYQGYVLGNGSAVSYYGTIVHVGLHAAWTTISPRWSGFWGLPPTPNSRTLPLQADAAGQKVIVLMTDGENVMMGDLSRGAPGNCSDTSAVSPRRPYGCSSSGTPSYPTTNTAYSSYRRLTDWTTTMSPAVTGRTINSTSRAVDELNDRLEALCANIKASGVRLYTVGFDLPEGSSNHTRLSTCANSAADYFAASSAAQLNAAFLEIANRVGRVRLVR